MLLSDYDFFRDKILELTGIEMRNEDFMLVESRLQPIARKWGYPHLQSMAIALRAMPSQELINDFCESILTTDTSFFRDEDAFATIEKTIIPTLINMRAKSKTLKIWSCGCATGQEVYSLAIMLDKCFPQLQSWKIEIIGTDMSEHAIQIAQRGIYEQFEAQRGLSPQDLITYFDRRGEAWEVKPLLRKRVAFKRFNILHDYFLHDQTYDFIICQNMMDSYTPATRKKGLEFLHKAIKPDGFLYLGNGEKPDQLIEEFLELPHAPHAYVLGEASKLT
jgi:chemotaxis protein methyltransferase CheR